MNNNLNFQFGIYEPATDSIIVNTGANSFLVIHCKECNSVVFLDDPNNIVYLYRLAEETPLLYAKLALKENGLQDYMDALCYSLKYTLFFVFPAPLRISSYIRRWLSGGTWSSWKLPWRPMWMYPP